MTKGVKIAVLAAIAGGLAILAGGLGVRVFGKLSALQITGYAREAGFTGTDLVIAVAIALAESSGDANAEGDKNAEGVFTSYGLWQIHWTVHPETYSVTPDELFDPQVNANAAFSIYSARGGKFTDWTTFNTQAYAKNLDVAQQGVNA